MNSSRKIQGGITAPDGFMACGVHSGIKKNKPDLALLVANPPANIAGVFTKNRIQGATVRLCRERLGEGKACAVVINSGNANACNGSRGMADAARMAEVTADSLDMEERFVFVCSTGTIGVPMPMEKVENGIRHAAGMVSPKNGSAAAEAIMTTDTVAKEYAVEISVQGVKVKVGGMAKGSGMISPDMATMLAFISTDAAVDLPDLQQCLTLAVEESFNRITVDGDQSCNDTVLLLANGKAGNPPLNRKQADWELFAAAVREVCRELAFKIVADGEGATKFVTVTVSGAVNTEDARRAARAVADSLLVKTSWYGCDPNWGRVIDAVGRSGADVREELVDISYDGIFAARNGCAAENVTREDLEKALRRERLSLDITLNLGELCETLYTCDCSEEYVRINAEYTT